MAEPRKCERSGCGAKMTPRWPRVRQENGELWCPSCHENHSHVQTTAAGWNREDVIRHEIGRQKVHTVNGQAELCPEHLRIHQSQNDFATGLAAQVGLDHSYSAPSISPPHEGRCDSCARQYGPDSKALPWENQHGTPKRITPQQQERQPTPHIDTDERLQRGRWPYRPHSPNRTERMIPVDTTIQSLNARTAAEGSRHPDIDWKVATFGVANTSLGRAGYGRRGRTAGITTHPFHDPEGWKMGDSVLTPVRHAIEGARAFANEKGLRDPHEHDFSKVMQSKDRVAAIGRHYDQMPDFDKGAVKHFRAMGDEVAQQHHFATHRMGIKFQTVDHDPYPDVHAMVHDVAHNKTLKVMGTHVTGSHPFFSDEDNDKFRGVHDLFGHAATGRDFSRHGEEAAFQAHSRMFSHHARPAMAAETRGQNSSVILNGDFGPQKVGVLPEHMHSDDSIDFHQRAASRRAVAFRMGNPARMITTSRIRVEAHDSGDGETIFHCPFCGSGQVIARSDGTVECEFCATAFTVQVQPQMPAFPQTIDGVPVDVPGMPAGGEFANVPAGSSPMEGMTADGPPGDLDDGTEADPTAQDDTEDGDGGDSGGGGKPDFLKASYHTDAGDRLRADQYARRLALQHLDRGRVLARIKERST